MLTRLKAQLFLQTLREVERVPDPQYAADLLKQLIGRTVRPPFWHERLAALVAPDGTISLNRWQEVPLLTPAEADRIGPEGLAVVGEDDNEVLDAGASAGPFRRRDKLALLADLCAFERILELHRLPLSGRLVDMLDQPFLFAEDWSWNTTFAKAPRETVSCASSPQTQIEALRAHPGSILRASPRTLSALLDAIASGAAFPTFAAVIAVGMPIADSLRRRLEEDVAPSVVAIWHDPRLGIIAFGDPSGFGWRVSSGTQFVEIVGADGRPCPLWTRGCIAVTPFYNYATPAIRFTPGMSAMSTAAMDGRQRLIDLASSEA
jgi:hypothetical protein